MVEELNILLDAAVELGKITSVVAICGRMQVSGVDKGGEPFALELTRPKEVSDGRN